VQQYRAQHFIQKFGASVEDLPAHGKFQNQLERARKSLGDDDPVGFFNHAVATYKTAVETAKGSHDVQLHSIGKQGDNQTAHSFFTLYDNVLTDHGILAVPQSVISLFENQATGALASTLATLQPKTWEQVSQAANRAKILENANKAAGKHNDRSKSSFDPLGLEAAHYYADAHQKGNGKGENVFKVWCKRCGSLAHDVKDCKIPSTVTCDACGGTGHMAHVCKRTHIHGHPPKKPATNPPATDTGDVAAETPTASEDGDADEPTDFASSLSVSSRSLWG
jgi:hypothetical protein